MTDIPGNSTTTATLTVGSSTTGNLEVVGDHDWFRVTLTAGQPVEVTLNGITLADPYLYVRDSSGKLLYSNDDIVDGVIHDSKVDFSPSYTGTYYIDVGAWNNAYAGTYQVSVQPYSSPPVATNDQIANQLTNGYWGGDYHHWAVTEGGTITVNISSLNASEQTLARAALAEWTDIIGVKFQEVSSGGQILFDDSADSSGNAIAATDANWSNHIITSAHVQISTSWVNTYGTGLYSYSFQTYVHEIGHALGLGHAGDYNNTATYPYDASFANDAWSTSIMSYFDQQENSYFAAQGFSRDFAVTPMAADILAMQSLYGLSTTTRLGDTTYGYNSSAGGVYDASLYPKAAYTIFDSGGNDTLDFSGSSAAQLINLNPETFSNVNGYTGNLSIARGVVVENAIGGGGADTIIGNSANNVLKGGLGSDLFTGGGGNDSYVDTIAGHSGDRITDFNAGDRLVFSDAALGSFTFSRSGTQLNYSGGQLTLDAPISGSLVASAAAGGGVQLAIRAHEVSSDFNGDSISDVLWRSDSGAFGDWNGQSGGTLAAGSLSAAASLDWHVAGIGDFNSDGLADLFLRNEDGRVADWLGQSNGSFVAAGAAINPGLDWQVVGAGDFNGDGRTDILWQNNDGRITDWLAKADGTFAGNGLNLNPGTSWHVQGTGDFNGDGRDDVLWRSNTGVVTDWLGQPGGSFTANSFSISPGADWHVVATGDFNGDGLSDVLWRNDSGRVTDWLGQPDGSFAGNGLTINLGSDWHAVGTGDYNGDGIDDVLWQNNDGRVTDWLGQPDGTFVGNHLEMSVAAGLHIQAPLVHDPFGIV